MGRRPCCAKVGLNRGSWSASEDTILTNYVLVHGEGKWRDLPRRAGLKRCGKSCRLRWLNYLRPDIKRGNITNEEEDLIIRLHNLLGNRWSLIAGRLPGRTDNEIKNYWNTNLRKRFNGSVNVNSGSPSNRTGTNRSQPSTTTKATVSRRTTTTTTTTTNTTTTSLVPQDHSVVRTKAVRCTGTYAVQTDDVLLQKNRESPANNPIQIGWPLPLESMRNDVDNPLGVFMDVDVGLQCRGSDHLMHVEQDKAQIADQEGNMFFFEDLLPLEDYWKDYLQPNVDSGDLKDVISFPNNKY